MIKTLIGYTIHEGMTAEEYEDWLFNVHVPDILNNPYVDRLVFNRVLRPVATSSDGVPLHADAVELYRIAEMHFADEEAHEKYVAWFREHPVPPERGPGGRTDFKFYVLGESVEFAHEPSAAAAEED